MIVPAVYYNDNDPRCCAWLRGLTRDLNRMASSASYQVGHGRLGIRPILFQAIYNCVYCAIAHFVHILVYGQHQALVFLHMIHNCGVHRGYVGRIWTDYRSVAALLWFFAGEVQHAQDFVCAIRELFLKLFCDGNHQSMTICSPGLDGSGTPYRNVDKCVQLPCSCDASSEMPLRIFDYSNVLACDVSESADCNFCTVLSPYTHNKTFIGCGNEKMALLQ